jgi:phage terminase large subunit GpA-like protein
MRRLAPPPRLTLSQWADQYRYLSPETSAEPGRWNTGRAEYLRGIMDAVSDPRIERVVFMASARVGKTEVINNLVGYHVGQDPAPILVVYPTETAAEEWSRDKLAPMLRDSPTLRAKIAPARSRDSQNTVLHKVFIGGRLYVVGANAPTGLAAKNIRIVCFDEVDRYGANAGGEGDPISQGVKRTQNFWNRKIVVASSPKLKGKSRIEAEYLASDQRRYYVPCPHCDHPQVLRWENVKWPEAGTREERSDAAAYHCGECGAAWTDAERWEAVAHAQRRGGGWRAENPGSRVAGFHLSVLYSPWRSITETVNEWLGCEKPEERQVFVNTSLGETWQERGDAPDWERLNERREDFPMGVVPAGALCLTAGVDAQDDRLEADVWAWGDGLTSWLVDRVTIPGSPREWAPWETLAKLLARDWPCAGGGAMRIGKACVDTGGRDTAAIYGHLRAMADPRIAPIKGVDRRDSAQPVQGPTKVDALVNGQKLRRGLLLWTVAVSTWKADLYRRLWLGRGDGEGFPPGWVHIPRAVDVEWVKQLVSEQLTYVKDKRGFARQEWSKLRDRNEALDCAVYARAALWLLGADRYGARFWDRLRAESGRRESEPAAPQVQAPVGVEVPAPSVAARPAPRPRWRARGTW